MSDPRCEPDPTMPYLMQRMDHFDTQLTKILEEIGDLKSKEASRAAERTLLALIGGWVVALFGVIGSAAGAIGVWHDWGEK